MSTILLLFDQGHPDPEDEEVKRYLAERALEPARSTPPLRSEAVSSGSSAATQEDFDAIADIQKKYSKRKCWRMRSRAC